MRCLAAALAGLLLLTGHVRAMQFRASGRTIYASGDIAAGDAGHFAAFIAAQRVQPTGIELDSEGGLIADAALMARTIRGARLSTTVRGDCASACFLMFMAGTDRAVADGSRVGVHLAETPAGVEDESSDASTICEIRYAAELGASAEALGRMAMTPASGIFWLTDDELRAIGARMVP